MIGLYKKVLSVLGQILTIHPKKGSVMTPLFKNGIATAPLVDLLKLTKVHHEGNLHGIQKATQDAWRQSSQHSGDIKDIFAHLKADVTPLFQELGYIGEQAETPLQHYSYGLVCGAYILAVRKRLALLKRIWEKGLTFDHLVLCGGKRAANPAKESLEIINKADGGLTLKKDWQPLTQVPSTEDSIMEAVLLQSDLPADWQSKEFYTVVDTPLRTDRPEKPDPSGEDTLEHWLETLRPKANSSVLLVYSQPQLRHMEVVARRIFEPMDIIVDCVGYEAPGNINVSQVLDTIAKLIYELAKSYWRVKVKTNHDGISMTSGSLIVVAMTEDAAAKEIHRISLQWRDDDYIPSFAKIEGPFPGYKEACGN